MVKKRGKSIPTEKGKHCLTCKLFSVCKDKRKKHTFLCTKFRAFDKTKSALNGLFDQSADKKRTEHRASILELKAEKKAYSKAQQKAFVKQLKSIIKDKSGIIRDLKVDDSDFKTAPNFITWCLSKKYLALDPKPFARQLQIGIHLFADYCPNKKCTNRKFIEEFPTDATVEDIRENVTMFRYGVCKKCGMTRSEAVSRGLLKPYQEFAGLVGQRGGKSYTSGLAFSYTTHRYLKLQNPSRYFGLTPTVLHGTFVALTFKQAKETLWDPFNEHLSNPENWFGQYHAFLKERGEKLGEQLYRHGEESINYRHRGLLIYPGSPNIGGLRGRTRFMCGIDEVGYFDNAKETQKVKLGAKEIYGALERSLLTLRSKAKKMLREGVDDVPMPMFFNIGSPFSKGDMMVELHKRSLTSKKIYGVHWPTWEMNPEVSFEDLAEEFDTDPKKAWRDYGARPPMSGNAFVSKVKHFEGVIGETATNAAETQSVLTETATNKLLSSGKLRWRWTNTDVPKLLTIDAGYKYNHFAYSVSHVTEAGLPVFDLMGEVMPAAEKPISFHDVYENILLPIVHKMNIVLISSDRWQNIKLMQDLEAETGVPFDEYRLKYNDFLAWREGLYRGDFVIPRAELPLMQIKKEGHEGYPSLFKNKPVSHFIFQCLTVNDVEGKTVEKGSDILQDDIFRTVVQAYAYLRNPETAMRFMGRVSKRGMGSHYGFLGAAMGSTPQGGGTPGGIDPSRLAIARASQGGLPPGANGFQGMALARGGSILR